MTILAKLDVLGNLVNYFNGKLIESGATPEEKKAIGLIDCYSFVLDFRYIGDIGCVMPPSTPQPDSDKEIFSDDFLAMRDFLGSHPDYSTRAANNIRKFYSLESDLSEKV